MSKQLKLAIEKDDANLVREALKKVKNLNRALPGADKPAFYACAKGAEKALEVLIDAGARTDGSTGFSAFDVATEHGQIGAMEVLRRRKMVTKDQFEWAMQRAIMDGKEKVVRYMVEKFKPKISTKEIKLAMIPKSAGLLKLFLEHGAKINALDTRRDVDKTAPLHGEARAGDPKTIRMLVEHGADVNVRDRDGRTPLMYLAADMVYFMGDRPKETMQAIRTLLELGADASLRDKDGNDVISVYEFDMRRSGEEVDNKVVDLFRKAGARGGGATSELFEAISDGDAARIREALGKGADLKQRNPFGTTPLVLGAAKGTTEIVQILLDAGADPNEPDRRETPLMSAASSGNLPVVKQLIAAGARPNALGPGSDDDPTPRQNALLAAEWSRKFEVVDYLKSLGGQRPKPVKWKPFKAGVDSWNDFDQLLVKAEVETVAQGLAKMFGAKVQLNAYGKSFTPGEHAYVVVRPVGMKWSNVFQVAPVPARFADPEKVAAFAKKLAAASGASVLIAEYSDTSNAAGYQRFEPDGSSTEDKGWDRESLAEMVGAMGKEAPAWAKKQLSEWDEDNPGPSSTERLETLAKSEGFVVAGFWLGVEPGRPVDMEFTGYPAEAFDGAAIIS